MALVAGSVTVDESGNRTGSGLALALYDASIDGHDDFSQTYPDFTPPTVTGKRYFAAQATRWASAIVSYFITNGTAKITTSASGLQRTPNPNNANTDCQAPTADKFLPIV